MFQLDAKQSPLALLAQTCSQIGADTSMAKPLHSPHDKSKKSPNSDRSSSAEKTKSRNVDLPFKPYEKTPKKPDSNGTKSSSQEESRKSDSANSEDTKKCTSQDDKCSSGRQTNSPDYYSSSPSNSDLKDSPEQKPITPARSETSPENTKEPIPCNTLSPTLEQTNPAFRSYPSPYSFQPPIPYPSGYTSPTIPYSNYMRVKASGTDSFVPVCKDPYCTGCFSYHNQMLMSPVPCPSGCTQCDHQKFMTMSLGYMRPYICNWITGDSYCGKRFVTSEELLQHLRSHTSVEGASTGPNALLNPFSMYRSSYLGAVSPLAARYHPYSKGLQTLIGSSYSAFSPTVLGPYYQPYGGYGQRPVV